MKKNLLTILSYLLTLIMLLGILASCGGSTGENSNGTTDETDTKATETESESQKSEGSEKESESESSSEQDSETVISLEGEDADLILYSNEIKNSINPHYDSAKNELYIDNTNMNLGYRTNSSPENNMLVSHLSTPDGHDYITDTMDVFLKMKSGNIYYSSHSIANASLNIYRYGYYFYENRLEGQVFSSSSDASNEMYLDFSTYTYKNGIKNVTVKNGELQFRMGAAVDPMIRYDDLKFNTADYDYLELTMKAESPQGPSDIFIIAGSYNTYTEDQRYSFNFIDDGEYHTYRVNLKDIKGYTGEFKALRLDINATNGAYINISKVRFLKTDTSEIPEDFSMQRSFLTYADKLHQLIQLSTGTKFGNVDCVGMITNIVADTVDKIVVKDKDGLKYSLEGVDWNSAEYVGFDIKNAGIFGYILPYDDLSGKLEVSLADGVYTITQTYTPENGEIIPSKNGTRNANDVYFGQRIYTDTDHSFDKFITEAECERNPLTEENIEVNTNHDSAKFLGYDALYGCYRFRIDGTGFNQAYYNYPNKQFRVCFTVKGDEYDRNMYFMTRCTSSGSLESAVLLDKNNMLLPVPMEVCKNFAGDGENTIYNLDDAAYGEAYFPMVVNAGETKEYSAVNLYQNWGLFPLKQISSIQFFTPYYHLSTGVTETNCIVPLATAGPGLPDHRAMSAPFWPTQPQHNSGGAHAFLRYTADGVYSNSSNTFASIDSYGPTYCDITLGFEGADGKISATYTHTEMPQVDENRAFYEMKYTFNEDVSFDDFAKDFTIYNVTDNNPKGTYKKVGYLDVNNQSQVVAAVTESGQSQEYVLGDNCPYFSFFDMPDYDKEYQHAFGYTNLSLLIYNYEIIVNGEKIDANFVIYNTLNYIRLTIDLEKVDFKAGDTISINAIIMPWGSQESDYSGDEPDFNVREVRRNTLLNPLTATAEKDCETLDSVFVPKLKTTNGKSAEFTLSGGNDNVSVRVYGFDTLTVPYIEEYVNGKWVEYKISSINNPDEYDYGYHYDGYMVHYDGDGTYSYSFVAKMDNGKARTFRISMKEDFESWPDVIAPSEVEKEPDPINVYADAFEFFQLTLNKGEISKQSLAEDKSYVRIFANPAAVEAYVTPFSHSIPEYANVTVTGQYLVLKYRLPKDICYLSNFEIFTSTENTGAVAGDSFHITDLKHDDEWHVVIVNVAQKLPSTFIAADDGLYYAQYARLDFFNGKISSSDMYIDIAYFGYCDDLDKLIELNSDMENVTLVENGTTTVINTKGNQE